MGAGVIIANNKCVCSEADCDDQECESDLPTMADDGTGVDLTIPSFILHKQDSDQLIDYLMNECAESARCSMKVDMKWFLPRPDDRVEWDLWTSPVDADAEAFKQSFKSLQFALADHQLLVPHYRIYSCETEDGCPTLCTNNGRYCHQLDPDGSVSNPTEGTHVVIETLRRKCIWNT